MHDKYPSYPMLTGLQKPLEFKGVRGRFLGWLAGIVGVGMMGMLVMLILIGFLVGFLFLVVTIAVGYLIIRVKQKQGIHNKKKSNELLIYHHLFHINK